MDDNIRRHWRELVQSDATWVPDPIPGWPIRGVTQGIWVTSDQSGIRGFLKPTVQATNHCAAYEKIAADIAHEIGVNVPPVVLYEREDRSTSFERFVAISLVPSGHCWGFREPPDPISDLLRASLDAALQDACGGIALDAWLGNRNRSNPDNLLFAMEEKRPLFYIDFSNSMDAADAWSRGEFDRFQPLRVPYLLFDALRIEAADVVATRIQNLPDALISAVVRRIPDNFMPKSVRRRTVEWLLWRKDRLREHILDWYPHQRG